MGNCCAVEGAIDHWIYVKTGDRKGSGTDANVRAIFYDDKGNQSQEIQIDCYFRNDFERGKTDVIQCPPLGYNFGNVKTIELVRDNPDVYPNWFCEVIVVNDRRTDKCFYFPVLRWMRPGVRYKIEQFGSLLPQYDPNHEQRRMELEERRALYQYGLKAPDMPVQIRDLPADEQYSDEYKWDIMNTRIQLLNKSNLPRTQRGKWQDLDEITTLYDGYVFYEPAGVDRWSNDLCFGAQRIIGCNPTMIKLCTALPENMGVTAQMLKPFLEGWSLKQIIEAKRLFVVDLKILEDLPTKNDNEICAPVALFFVTGAKQLVPIGIQLYQDITPDNPVYLPNDPPFCWILAKMWFNHADASIHQAITHFGHFEEVKIPYAIPMSGAYTHLIMEGMAISMYRHLSTNHPIYKLLAPHLQFIISINNNSVDKLLEPGGWVDNCMSIGREGVLELIRRGCEEWRMDVHGSFQKELESRGVLDPKALPFYAYRDDAGLIYRALDTYAKKFIRYYYDTPEKISQDFELQNWIAELALPKERGGVGLKGVPNNGHVTREEEIRLVCDCVMFTCSAQHAAVNFSQYDEYGFPPNYPMYLDGEPPIDKVPKSEDDILEIIPPREISMDTMVITKLLSSRGTKSLGEWEFQYQYDPYALKAENEFREELQQISQVIKQRNEQRDEIYKYPYLDPEIVPSSISI